MKFLTIILQETTGAGGSWQLIVMMVAIFAIMYFLMIRPQQKKQKELQKFRNSIQKGDKVVTIGGIYGSVDEVADTYVMMRIDTNVHIKVAKSSIVKDFSDVQQ